MYGLQFADNARVTNLAPIDTESDPFYFTFKVQCTSCRETHPNLVTLSRFVRVAALGRGIFTLTSTRNRTRFLAVEARQTLSGDARTAKYVACIISSNITDLCSVNRLHPFEELRKHTQPSLLLRGRMSLNSTREGWNSRNSNPTYVAIRCI
jgi:Eukaryotic protein of unknown function (DUF866)